MAWPIITKGGLKRVPQLDDYDQTRTTFAWQQAQAELAGLPEGRGLNMAHEAVDRHLAEGHGDRVALRVLAANPASRSPGTLRDVSYAELAELTNRCARLLGALGLLPGDTVATLLDRGLDLITTALGCLKAGGVFCPLFPVLGPEPLRARLALGGARVLVTTRALYERKVKAVRHLLPELRHVLVVDGPGPDVEDFQAGMAAAPADYTIAPTAPTAPALLHFTSGTTGVPKGAIHSHAAILGQRISARMVLDLTAEDVFWCTADAGWVTGTVYGILAPLALGATCLIDPEPFDAGRWYATLSEHKVSVLYTTPTAIRMLMRFGSALARTYRFPALRLAASVGEPLNPEAVLWGREALGVPLHDTWWQTETGCITIANFPALPIKPGSMGRPLPGFETALVERLGAAELAFVDDPGRVAEIAVKVGPPSLFTAYLGEPQRTAESFVGDWYLTGDLARRDADGCYWFVGRADDVIKSAGHLIGPFEVESALMDHPAVAEAGVIGRPDPLVHEVVTAYVTLNPGFVEGEALRKELLVFARDQLGSALAPRDIQFAQDLPKTNSGKVMRRMLRLRDLGVSDGDLAHLARTGEG